MANTPWAGNEADKLYLTSGQFSSTLKTSQAVGTIDVFVDDVSWDGTNTPWAGNSNCKLYLQSGQFSSTLKTSQAVGGVDSSLVGISWDGTNTPWAGNEADKLYLQSGQFTSTLKTSEYVGGVDTTPQSISFDGTNTPWIGWTDDKLYLTSGQFTSTLKTSEDISGINNLGDAISWDGTNTPWCGLVGAKLYLQSGQFTSTLKTSQSVTTIDTNPSGIDTNDIDGRLGTGPTNHWWLGTTNTDHAVAANWSTAGSGGAPGASVPGAGDEVQFDGNGNNACTLTANWALLHLTTLAGYTVKLDLATFNLTMDDSGNIILDQGGEFDAGTGTISLTNGDFDNLHVTTFTRGTSTLVMSGTGNLVSNVLNDLNDLTINIGAVITATETYQILGSLIVNGSLSIASGKIASVGSGGTISIGAAGRITGNGTFRVYVPGAGEGITAFTVGGVIDVSTLEIFRPNAAAVIAPGTYQSTLVKIYNNVATTETLTLSNGNYIFTGNVEFENTNAGGSLIIANNTNDPDIELQGDFLVDEQAGTIIWTKGNGTITASGANAQDWDLLGRTVEDIIVNKTNKTDVLTFSGPLTTDSLTVTKGTIDPNGQTITIVGNMTMTTNGQFDPAVDAMDGCDFAIGNDIDFDGSNGDPLIMKWQVAFTLDVANDCNLNWVTFTPSDPGGGKVDMLLEVSGSTAVATNCVAEYSNAGGYTTIQATTSTNSGNNTNWAFAVPKSATSALEFTQTEIYTAEYLREESGSLILSQVVDETHIQAGNTPWSGATDDKLYLTSGQFSSTLKTSQAVGGVDSIPIEVTWDGTNTPWSGDQAKKLYLTSGQFSSTIKTSEDIGSIDNVIVGISCNRTDTPWVGLQADKLYLQSGQFTSTLKTSEYIGSIDSTPTGIAFDSTNTPWSGLSDDKLYLQSGQFTSTLKTSEFIGSIELSPHSVTWDGINTPWIGSGGNKLYLQSGQFTSTLKTSENVSGVDTLPTGIETNAFNQRLSQRYNISADIIFAHVFTGSKEMMETPSASLIFSATETYLGEYTRGETASLIFTQAAAYGLEAIRSESGALIFEGIVNIPIHLKSVSNDLIFGQSVSYSKETTRVLASTLALNSVVTRSLETTKSISSSVVFTHSTGTTYREVNSSNIEFGGAVSMELERTLPQNLVFTQTVSYLIGIEPTVCELKQHWPRWIFASTTKYFEEIAVANDLHFFIEGTHRFTPEHQEYLEFRMDGPSVTEVSKNYFLIDVEINILWSFNQDNTSFHRASEITGILMEAMEDICVYRYGDGEHDNQKLLGTLTLRQDKKTPIRVNNFGQVRTDVKLMQGTVEGTFRMTLTCTRR